MCGRFALSAPATTLVDFFALDDIPPLSPRYNIAPTQPILAVRSAQDGKQEVVLLRWGLVPSWSRDPSGAGPLINARAETVHEKPAFRAAFSRRRCLVPADAFYEWQTLGRKKMPVRFSLHQAQPFAIAGLWDRWEGPNGVLESCALLTTEANERVRPVHDRMPVLLAPEHFDLWLGGTDRQRLRDLLRPYSAEELTASPVSTRLNNARLDDIDCLAPPP